MNFDWSVVAEKKRAVFTEPMRVFFGSPNSDDYKTLPAGEPSGVVTSFTNPLIDGVNVPFIQIEGDKYVKLTGNVKYVDDNYSGGAGAVSKIFYFLSDTAGNAANDIKNAGGYLAEGWEQTKNRSFFEMLDFAGLNSLKKSIIVGGILLVVVLMIQITSKFR